MYTRNHLIYDLVTPSKDILEVITGYFVNDLLSLNLVTLLILDFMNMNSHPTTSDQSIEYLVFMSPSLNRSNLPFCLMIESLSYKNLI